jgi:hypothetical protein
VEIDPGASETLRINRPALKVIEEDIRLLEGFQVRGLDLLSGGVLPASRAAIV